MTRRDVSFAASYLATYQSRPGQKHLEALKYTIAYLYGTKGLGLTYRLGAGDTVFVHCDASWNESHTVAGCKCMGGFCVHQYGLIGCHCGRQPTVALSTQEAELNEVVNAGKYLVWLKGFMEELNCPIGDVRLFEDNNPVVLAANNYGSKHSRLKHVLRKVYKVHEWIVRKIFVLVKIATANNIADIFTKRLDEDTFVKFRGPLMGSPVDAEWELPTRPVELGTFATEVVKRVLNDDWSRGIAVVATALMVAVSQN